MLSVLSWSAARGALKGEQRCRLEKRGSEFGLKFPLRVLVAAAAPGSPGTGITETPGRAGTSAYDLCNSEPFKWQAVH